MDSKVNALVITSQDSVAVAIEELQAGEAAVYVIDNTIYKVDIVENIPLYHKFAVVSIKKDSAVYKYGEIIGKAVLDIKKGQHVHSHNLISIREYIEG